jgi:hypothetical protein
MKKLSEDQIKKITRIHAVFFEVLPVSLDETLTNFKRDLNPDSEIEIWMGMADEYEKCIENSQTKLDLNQKKEIFKSILSGSMMSDHVRVGEKRISAIVLSCLLTAIIIGSSVYFWEQKKPIVSVIPNEELSTEESPKIEIPLDVVDVRTTQLNVNKEFLGFVKIILKEQGFEHISTPLTIQWLNETRDQVIKEMNFNQGGYWSLQIDSIEYNLKGVLLKLSGSANITIDEGPQERNFEIQIEKDTAISDLWE